MNKRPSTSPLKIRGWILFLGLMVLVVSPAAAIFIGNVDLGTAGPDSYTLLTIDTGTKLTANNQSAITGNVGVLGGSAEFSSSADAFIDGTAFLAGSTSIDPSRAASIVTNADAQLQQARMDALNAASFAAGLAPTIATAQPSLASAAAMPTAGLAPTNATGNPVNIGGGFGQMTISGGAGTNVINLWDLKLSNNDVLTLDAPAGSAFILNIFHDFKVSGSTTGGRIQLAGGLTPFDVLYNVLGVGSDVALTGTSAGPIPNAQVYGIVLAPHRNIESTPGIVFGEIIGGAQELTLTFGADPIGLGANPVPEVSAFAPLLGILSLASAFHFFRRKRRHPNAM